MKAAEITFQFEWIRGDAKDGTCEDCGERPFLNCWSVYLIIGKNYGESLNWPILCASCGDARFGQGFST